MEKHRLYINGQWEEPSSGEYFESFDPFLGEPWALVAKGGPADVDRAVAAAKRAFDEGEWPSLTPSGRGALLRKVGDLIAANAQRLAELEVKDNGKLLAEMGPQLGYVPQWFYYYGGLADKIEGSVIPIDKPGMVNFTRHEPLGVVATITPWNSPILLAVWKMAPALAAGNTLVIKPSEHTSISMLEFVKLFEEAGFPKGVINVVTGFGADVGEPLTVHPDVAKVAFTGGEAGGAAVYQAAAKGLKRVSLELGGKSPNIVFADARIDDAVKGAVSGIFAATGQTCMAGSRLLVERSVHDEFVEKLVALSKTAKMGNPASMETQIGPVTTRPQYERVLNYIEVAKGEGANCVLGGGPATRPECGNGWFVEPTIFTGVDNAMRIAQEEVFGPVLSIIAFDEEEQAITIANDVLYGLAAGVWTEDMRRAFRFTQRLKAGTVWVNAYRAVSYMSPFGGYKRSGIGRENGQEMMKDYMQTKSVWFNISEDEAPNPFVLR